MQFLFYTSGIYTLYANYYKDKLNGLTTLSTESEMLKNIDVDVIIYDFVSQKARKKPLLTSPEKDKFLDIL